MLVLNEKLHGMLFVCFTKKNVFSVLIFRKKVLYLQCETMLAQNWGGGSFDLH